MAVPKGTNPDDEYELGDDVEVLADLDGQEPVESDADDDDIVIDDGGDEAAEPNDESMIEDESWHSFEGHQDSVLSVAWSPAHPDLVATGGQDDTAFIWRVGQDAYEDNSDLGTMELAGHKDSIVSTAFNHNGTLLATASMDGTAKVWDPSNGQLLQTLEGPAGSLEWCTWHPKGNVLLAGSDDMSLWMWLAQAGSCMQVFYGHSGPVTAGAFTPDGKSVVSVGGEGDCSLRVWNPKTGECCVTIKEHNFHQEGITCLAVHQDGGAALTGAEDGSVRLTNIQTQAGSAKRIVGALDGHEESCEAVGLARGLPLAATAGMDGKLLIWDLNAMALRQTCEHPAGVVRLAWHPTQPLVASACLDGVARVWDLRTATSVKTLTGHRDSIQDVSFSPDGGMLLCGSDDKTAKVFKL